MRLRCTRRGFEEVPPQRCFGCGEPFRPGQVSVGIQHCTCERLMHRSHFCRRCGTTTLTPPAGERCKPRSLDGR